MMQWCERRIGIKLPEVVHKSEEDKAGQVYRVLLDNTVEQFKV